MFTLALGFQMLFKQNKTKKKRKPNQKTQNPELVPLVSPRPGPFFQAWVLGSAPSWPRAPFPVHAWAPRGRCWDRTQRFGAVFLILFLPTFRIAFQFAWCFLGALNSVPVNSEQQARAYVGTFITQSSLCSGGRSLQLHRIQGT